MAVGMHNQLNLIIIYWVCIPMSNAVHRPFQQFTPIQHPVDQKLFGWQQNVEKKHQQTQLLD